MVMKRFDMTQRKGKPGSGQPKKSQTVDSAFDVWLNRSLHQLFDEVAREPIPEEFLKLIREDDKK